MNVFMIAALTGIAVFIAVAIVFMFMLIVLIYDQRRMKKIVRESNIEALRRSGLLR